MANDPLRAQPEDQPVDGVGEPAAATLDVASAARPSRWSPTTIVIAIAASLLASVSVAGLVLTQSTPTPRPATTEVLEVVEQRNSSAVSGDMDFGLRIAGPIRDGVRTFEVELVNTAPLESVVTKDLAITVETSDGVAAVTITRFDRSELRPGERTVATLRVEGASVDHSHVVLRRDSVELGRVRLSS